MSYGDTIRGLAGDTERQALLLFAAWQAGDLTDTQFEAALAVLVSGANAQAVTVADLSLSAALTVALRRPVPPLGLLPEPGGPARLAKASRTLLETIDDTPDPPARVARLARAEPLTTGAHTFSEGIARSEHATGWTRGLNGKACQLCRWWARGGQVFKPTTRMPTHPGCSCTPIPVTLF